jgi:hypothetical protein
MRTRLIILSVAMLPAVAVADLPLSGSQAVPVPLASAGDADTHQDQVQAATANATANLRDQILRTRLSREITVGDFLDRTNSQPELTRILKTAQPIGGPRWVDERTCQVRVELPATTVAAMLLGIAHAPDQHPPINPETLKAKFGDWNRIKFSVVGSSAGGDAVEQAKPHDSIGKWSEVSDAARRAAIGQARADVARQIEHEMEPITLSGNVHAADAMARPEIAANFNRWLQRQPVTRIDFLDDLKVSVTISTSSRSLAAAFKSAVESDGGYTKGLSIDWKSVNEQIDVLPASVVGSGAAYVAGPGTTLPSIVLPLQSPDWVDRQLQAEASASGGGSRLKVGHSAEADAVGKLRDQFLQLHLDSSITLGDAARSDPQLNQAVDRALQHAHTYRVDYRADGSVKVQMTLDLRDAWDALRANP